MLWRLTKLPYGIVEAGRQWQKTIENRMMSEGGLSRVFGLSQLFVQRNESGRICNIVAKVTDDFLIGGTIQNIQAFIGRMGKRFDVGKTVMDKPFLFDGCEIEQDHDGNIKISMHRCIEKVKHIPLSRQRRKQIHEPVSEDGRRHFRTLAGTLLYLGNGVLPQASFVTSIFQQKISALSVRHLVEANNMIDELLCLSPWIKFIKSSDVRNVIISSFSDASHPKDRDYGQSGIICGLRIITNNGVDLFHTIDWFSHKQKRVSYSSYGAEIFACASADDRGYYLRQAINSIFPNRHTRHELSIDS